MEHREFSCEVSGIAGHESEVLRLRNENRDRPETLEYLAWRYQHLPDAPQPLVFWLVSTADGRRIGMAAALFRPYWIDGKRVQVAVVGDISLAAPWRGRGLGQVLLRFMTEHLERHFPEQPAFVIPTEAARRALAACGWVQAGSLIPYVFVLDPTHYVRPFLRSERLAQLAARPLRALARAAARLRGPRDGSLLRIHDSPDEAVREFAARLPPAGGAVHDLGPESLGWRYARHPRTHFQYATLARAGETRGLLIFANSTVERSIWIYDLSAPTRAEMTALLSLFLQHALSMPDAANVRVTLAAQHPCRAQLRWLGFIARPPDAVFQVHSRSGLAERVSWLVTPGDKDT
jgi:GNAT superfamily N-acetyltransferase